MTLSFRLRLSGMMFLEFFIWGAWSVTMGTYLLESPDRGGLGANAVEVGLAFATQSIGAIIAPFIVGLIADKFFSAQKILGILSLIGSILLWFASVTNNFGTFYLFILVYTILYMPTTALVNSISMRQMSDPEKEFPFIRVVGTIGWIVAGLIIMFFNWGDSGHLKLTFKMAGIVSFILGIYSFSLPPTLPLKKGTKTTFKSLLGFDALNLLKKKSFLIFFIASVAICIPTAFYYSFTNPFLSQIGMRGSAGQMTIGQGSQVLFMLSMPFLIKKIGFKKMLALGMAAWTVRYFCFALGYAVGRGGILWILVYSGIALHGISYEYFFVTGQIYTNNRAGKEIQSAAQGLISIGTFGVGMLIGSLISGVVAQRWTSAGGAHNWFVIWLIPSLIALSVLIPFMILFREDGK